MILFEDIDFQVSFDPWFLMTFVFFGLRMENRGHGWFHLVKQSINGSAYQEFPSNYHRLLHAQLPSMQP